MLNIKNYITINSEILGGQPVFKNTRVTVQTLFDHLEKGETLDSFLMDFPTVTKEQSVAVIEIAAKLMSAGNLIKLYETAA